MFNHYLQLFSAGEEDVYFASDKRSQGRRSARSYLSSQSDGESSEADRPSGRRSKGADGIFGKSRK